MGHGQLSRQRVRHGRSALSCGHGVAAQRIGEECQEPPYAPANNSKPPDSYRGLVQEALNALSKVCRNANRSKRLEGGEYHSEVCSNAKLITRAALDPKRHGGIRREKC